MAGVKFPQVLHTRVDTELSTKLDKIAAYEHSTTSNLVRSTLVVLAQKYDRNPQYLRWLRQLEETRESSGGIE